MRVVTAFYIDAFEPQVAAAMPENGGKPLNPADWRIDRTLGSN
jgi:hypothetical protein